MARSKVIFIILQRKNLQAIAAGKSLVVARHFILIASFKIRCSKWIFSCSLCLQKAVKLHKSK